jgi:amino acid adenylation domain-containing protein
MSDDTRESAPSAEQRRRQVEEFNRTERDYPSDLLLHELFERRVALAPDAPALEEAGGRLSYAELDVLAARMAARLRALGVGPESLVAVMLERSSRLVATLLGVLKAGGAYVPLDPSYPSERLRYMLEDSGAKVLVTEAALLPLAPAAEGVSVVTQEEVSGDGIVVVTMPVAPRARPENLAYVIYTSGSTGRPKGIAVTHGGVVNNVVDLNESFSVGAHDSVLALSSPSFDMSVYEFFGMLGAGGKVVIPDGPRAKDVAHWAELIRRHGVTVWNSAPSLLKALVDYVEGRAELRPASLRLALLGGDWIPVSLPDRLKALAEGLEFISLGGATEASIHSMIYVVEESDPAWKSIPYGRPMANQRAYLLDPRLEPLEACESGEIHYGGVGLARGYLGRPALTAEKFIPDPFGAVPGARMYKTNDAARFRPDGEVELIGRMDFQVKIRGMRVELDEIAAALRRCPAVRECVVLAREDTPGDKRLVAYVVPEAGQRADAPALRRRLAESLPDYMLPAAFVELDALPLSPNGKIDRRALPAPGTGRPELEEPFAAARTPVEEVIVGVWSEVLGVERVGVRDDFAELGGHSLHATRIASRLRETFAVEVPLRALFESATVARQGELVESLGREARTDVTKAARLHLLVNSMSDAEVLSLLAGGNG